MDETEREYLRLISEAIRRGDNNAAHELSIGLGQYRAFYQVPPRPEGPDEPCAFAAHNP